MPVALWYFELSGRPSGPVTEEALLKMIRAGDIEFDCLVWAEGQDDWQPASQVPQLVGQLAPAPPPLPAARTSSKELEESSESAIGAPRAVAPSLEERSTLNNARQCHNCSAPVDSPFTAKGRLFCSSRCRREYRESSIGKVQPPRTMPIWKFCLLSGLTFGIYEVVWFYRQWKYIRDADAENVQPLARAVFGHIFAYHLMKRHFPKAAKLGFEPPASPLALTVLYFLISAAWRLPNAWSLLSSLGFISLIPLVQASNLAQMDLSSDQSTHLTEGEFAWLLLGGVLTAMVVFGAFSS